MKFKPSANTTLIACVLTSVSLFACSGSSSSPDATGTNDSMSAALSGDEFESSASTNELCTVSTRALSDSAPYVGNIHRPETSGDERFHSLWNQVTPENSGKWFNVESTRNFMDWGQLDNAVAFANDFGYTFKLHTLIAGGNEPAWMASLTEEEQETEIVDWFNELAIRYPEMQQIEVVSEPVSEQPNYINALGGAGDTGWDWVIRAFELARSRFPNSDLILNGYKVAPEDQTGESFLALVELLIERNLIDAVGVEGHFLEAADAVMVSAKLDALAVYALPIYLSDLDINLIDDQQQLDQLQALWPVFYEHASMQGLTFWGYRQNQLWRSDAYLLNSSEQDRPALDWLECYLGIDAS